MIDHIELNTGAEPNGTVIWMHGLGADCWDFVPVVKELGLPANLPLRFIFPQAPMRPITINNRQVMPGWYDISMAELQRKPDEAGVRQSQAFIEELIAREVKRGIPADKIILAGFSQGGAIALQTGLRHREALGGIMALSTYLTLDDSLAAEASIANANIPILMAHGTQDPIVPLALAVSSRTKMEARGYKIEWREYPMPHSICMEEIEEISVWIQTRFKSRILLA
ncbi:MAG: dienelactone hydrolase family protein [Betaproteobacteria bacterium]